MATLKNTTINDTGFITVAVGTTAERPASPVNGMIRFNTTLGYIDWYSTATTSWLPISNGPSYTVEYVVVAGGGSGAGYGLSGGGGGAGGLLVGSTSVNSQSAYPIVVGAGGIGNGTQGSSGSTSTGFSLTSIGGGAGGS
jgi:hypothetical protein